MFLVLKVCCAEVRCYQPLQLAIPVCFPWWARLVKPGGGTPIRCQFEHNRSS